MNPMNTPQPGGILIEGLRKVYGKGDKAKADPEQTHGFGCFTDPRPCRGRGVV